MDAKLIQQLIESVVPAGDVGSLTRSNFMDSVKSLQGKIIDMFRYSTLQYVPLFLKKMIDEIQKDTQNGEKQKRFTAAVRLTALIQLFPFDDYVPQFRPAVEQLLTPGYKPIVQIGAVIAGRLARISGHNRDEFLRAVIHENKRRIEIREGDNIRYAGAVTWRELAKEAPELFFSSLTGSEFARTVMTGLQKGNEEVCVLIIDVMKALFGSEAASVGSEFLTELHTLMLTATTKGLTEFTSVEDLNVHFRLLKLLLKLKPYISGTTASSLLFPKCVELLDRVEIGIVDHAIRTIIALHEIGVVKIENDLFQKIHSKILALMWAEHRRAGPLMLKFIRAFPGYVEEKSADMLANIQDICARLPSNIGPQIAYNLTVALIESLPTVANIRPFISNVDNILARSSVVTPIHLLLRVLNQKREKWPVSFGLFKNEVLHVIRQELTNPIGRGTDRILISLLALKEIPITNYTDALELNTAIMKLTNNKDIEVRQLLASASIHLFNNFEEKIPLVTIQRLVVFALEDPARSVRQQSLHAFKPITYSYIAQPDILPVFSRFIYDESPDVRKEALYIFRFLPIVNATILRNAMLSSLKQMTVSINFVLLETAPYWIVFPHLLVASKTHLHYYADSIFERLMEILNKRFSDSQSKEKSLIYMQSAIFEDIDESLIKSIARLRQICPYEVPIQPILTMFCKILRHPGHPWTKIHVLKSLKNLGTTESIAEIKPELIDILVDIVMENASLKLVTKALKVIGSIGFVKIGGTKGVGPLVFRPSLSNQEHFRHYYVDTLVKHLNKLFSTVNLGYTKAIALAMNDVYRVHPELIPEYLEPFLSTYLEFIKSTTTEDTKTFLEYLTEIINSAGHLILEHTYRIFQSIEHHWHGNYTRDASMVFSAVVRATHGRCENILNLLVSISFLLMKSKPDVDRFAREIFILLRTIAQYAPPYLPTVIAGVIGIVNSPNLLMHTLAVETLEFILRYCKSAEYASPITRCLNQRQGRLKSHSSEDLTALPAMARIGSCESFMKLTPSASRSSILPLEFDTLLENLEPRPDELSNPAKLAKWFKALRQSVIEYSPSEVIRTLLRLPQVPKFAFKFAFLELWLSFDPIRQEQIGNQIGKVFAIECLPEFVLEQFIDLVEFSVLCEVELVPDMLVVINRCVSARYFAKALFFIESYASIYQRLTKTPDVIETLVRMNEHVERLAESRAIAFAFKDKIKFRVWMTLGEWDLALEQLNREDQTHLNVADRVKCLAALDHWQEVYDMKAIFTKQSLERQTQLARYFWMASLYHGTKEESLRYLNQTGGYTVDDCIQMAILYCHLGKMKEAGESVHLGWRYLGSSVAVVEKHNKTLIKKHLLQAEQLHELTDVFNILQGTIPPDSVKEAWASRLEFLRDDPMAQKELYKIRAIVHDRCDLDDFAFDVLSSTVKGKYSRGAERMVEILFPDAESERAQYAKIRLMDPEDGIKAATELLATTKDSNLKTRLQNHLGQQLVYLADTVDKLREALSYLVAANKNKGRIVNTMTLLAHTTHDSNYATQAATFLSDLVKSSPTCLNIHQLLALLISFSQSKETTSQVMNGMNEVSPRDLLNIAYPSLMALGHSQKEVVLVLKSICARLASSYPQAIAFDVLNNLNIPYAEHLLGIIQKESPVSFQQISLISKSLVKITNTLYDQWVAKIWDAITKAKEGDSQAALAILRELKPTLRLVNISAYDSEFMDHYRDQLRTIVDTEPVNIDDLVNLHRTMTKKQDAVRVIPLSSLDEQLERKTTWHLSILGLKGFTDDVKIAKFVNSVERLDNGFGLSILGSNGKKYSYHLLRVRDEAHHMQQGEHFMHLLNSMNPTHQLSQRAVIKLSPTTNLIQLLKGRLQLLSFIVLYNKSKGKANVEAGLLAETRKFELLDEKSRVKEIGRYAKDEEVKDLAKAILVTSQDAMTWIQRTSTFARSMGVLSAMSYIFGLFDTSLGAILFDKATGAATYTNFTLSGKAHSVPFRMTQMIVEALGTCGVDGPFAETLSDTLHCTRKNAGPLANILQLAICNDPYEPSVVPDKYLSPFLTVTEERGEIDEVYDRIDFDGAVNERVRTLIDKARSPECMAQMPARWMAWM